MSTQDAPLPHAPTIIGDAPRVLVIRAPYYRAIAEGLTHGALRILHQAGAQTETEDVAGALELPQACLFAARGTKRFDAYVALGCVVRGDTDHYDHVCRAAMDGLMRVSLDPGLIVGNGLLTVHDAAQAVARSGADGHNKGAEAAMAALMQLNFARRVGT